METKKFTDGQTDGRTDAEGYNIIRLFFKGAYKNWCTGYGGEVIYRFFYF